MTKLQQFSLLALEHVSHDVITIKLHTSAAVTEGAFAGCGTFTTYKSVTLNDLTILF